MSSINDWDFGVGGICKCGLYFVAKDPNKITTFEKCPDCELTFADLSNYWKQIEQDLGKQIAKEKMEAAAAASSSPGNGSGSGSPIMKYPSGFTNVAVKNLFDKVANLYNKHAKPFDDAETDIGKVSDGTMVQKYFDFYDKQSQGDKGKMNKAITTACESDDADACVKILKEVADGTFAV
jgi:hypothetical protein